MYNVHSYNYVYRLIYIAFKCSNLGNILRRDLIFRPAINFRIKSKKLNHFILRN